MSTTRKKVELRRKAADKLRELLVESSRIA